MDKRVDARLEELHAHSRCASPSFLLLWLGGTRGIGLVAAINRGLAPAADTESRADEYDEEAA